MGGKKDVFTEKILDGLDIYSIKGLVFISSEKKTRCIHGWGKSVTF